MARGPTPARRGASRLRESLDAPAAGAHAASPNRRHDLVRAEHHARGERHQIETAGVDADRMGSDDTCCTAARASRNGRCRRLRILQSPTIGPESVIIRTMKQVSIQDLKAGLSAAVAEAESGRTIVITRHNEPVAQLGPARVERVHRGARVGQGRVQPALKRGTKGRYLAVLQDDRGSR